MGLRVGLSRRLTPKVSAQHSWRPGERSIRASPAVLAVSAVSLWGYRSSSWVSL